jgi:hypothetical protein
MARVKRSFVSPDGTPWRVEVQSPGASNAQVVFVHPDGRFARLNRYAHYLVRGPESQNVSGRVDPQAILASLSDATVATLFRNSMPIAGHPTIEGQLA